jgi:hypothetical protein
MWRNWQFSYDGNSSSANTSLYYKNIYIILKKIDVEKTEYLGHHYIDLFNSYVFLFSHCKYYSLRTWDLNSH